MRLLYVYLLLFFSIFCFSQERKQIKGKVYILDNKEESVSGIYVKNNSTNYTTITDITGNFIIPAQKGDEIVFQAYNIEKRMIPLTSIMESNQQMTIQLDVREKVLEEVIIVPFKSYGSIELDVKRIPMMNKTNELMARLGDLTPTKKLDGSTDIDSEVAKLASIKFGIDGILDLLSGDGKRREKLTEYETQANIIRDIREYFGDEYFKGIGLQSNEIDEFILYTYLNHNIRFFYNHNNYFQILNVFDKNILAYRSRKGKISSSVE